MQAICHSSILELQELFEGDNYIYTITQLYSGPKLSDVILNEDFVLDDKVVSLICLRLLEALAHLESKQIIHRDLKPDNIVFRNPNDLSQPVLVDLGFATYIKDFAYLFTRCGTPGYVAPEILLDQPYDCKADVFSLGVTLYMLVNRGTNPFISEDYQQLVDNNAMGVVDYTPIEERWLTPLIQQMLEPNPHQRPSAVQLMNAYAHILEKGPEPMTDGSAHSSAARPVPSENFGSSGHEIDELQLSVQKIVGTGEDSQLLPTATKNLELELSQASEAIAVSIPYAAESPEASATELPEAADSG